LANYIPRPKGDIFFDQTFSLSDVGLVGKTITMNIRAPEIMSPNMALGLKEMRVTMTRGPFPWDKIWKKLSLKK
jgi:hypothetical protein